MKILKFSATWCAPCRDLATTIAEISDNIGMDVEEIDVDSNAALATKYNIRSVPTMIIVDGDDDTEIKRHSGNMTAAEITKWVKIK